MTREEAIKDIRDAKNTCCPHGYYDALDMAIEALEGVCFDEWCDDCKEYDTEKKCCPRFNKVIREAMKRIPHDDGTLEVKVEDATKVGRVLISDDKHRGGLYYPDEYEPKGKDLISRAEAIKALGEEPLVWCDDDAEIAERSQWRDDVEAIKSVPSADRPRGEFDGMIFSTDKYMAFIDKKEIHIMRKSAHKITVERMFNTEEDEYKPMPKHGQSADRPSGEWTTDEVAELLANIFGDECACNWNRNDEWLPEVCKYAETTCPSPKEANGCWKQFLIQGGARRK